MTFEKQTIDSGVNHSKRKVLKSFGAIAASGIVTTPTHVFAETTHTTANTNEADDDAGAPDLEIMMVSKVDVPGESILLSNLTDRSITVSRFQSSRLIFDGEIVDCNDACRNSPITIPAHQERLVQFRADNRVQQPMPAHLSVQTHRSAQLDSSGQLTDKSRADYINVHSTIRRLPQGTRVLKLSARMQGSTALLSDDAEPARVQRNDYNRATG